MALTRPFGIDQAYPNAYDVRWGLVAASTREGMVPGPNSLAGLITAGTGWTVNLAAFIANYQRGASSATYRSAFVANDATLNVTFATTAPASGSQYFLLYLYAQDPTQGDTITIQGSETVARGIPSIGVVAGTAATTPTVPALPAGGMKIGTVLVPSSATSATSSGVVIASTYDFTHSPGSAVYCRAITDLAATAFGPRQRAFVINGPEYINTGTAWAPVATEDQAVTTGAGSIPASVTTGITNAFGLSAVPYARQVTVNGTAYVSAQNGNFLDVIIRKDGSATGQSGRVAGTASGRAYFSEIVPANTTTSYQLVATQGTGGASAVTTNTSLTGMTVSTRAV